MGKISHGRNTVRRGVTLDAQKSIEKKPKHRTFSEKEENREMPERAKKTVLRFLNFKQNSHQSHMTIN